MGGGTAGSGVLKGVLDPAGAVWSFVTTAYEVDQAKNVTHNPSAKVGVVLRRHPMGVAQTGFPPVGVGQCPIDRRRELLDGDAGVGGEPVVLSGHRGGGEGD